MPNGEDRNFVRFIGCIGGFRDRFNKWPTKMKLDPDFIEELTEVLPPEDFQKLTRKMELIADDSNPWDGLYVAEDGEGHVYDLMKSGHGGKQNDVLRWLCVSWPNY